MRPDDPTESYQTLHGFPHHLRRRQPQAVGPQPHGPRQPGAQGALPEHRARGPAGARRQQRGSGFPQQLDDFLFEYGWRHDAVYDLADMPWRENPAIPLASIAKMTWSSTTARTPRSSTGRRSPARSCSPRPAPGWPTSPRRSPASTGSTSRRPTASRSPRTTPSTSTSSSSACSAGSASPSATGSWPRASSTSPTTSSTSTARRGRRRAHRGGDRRAGRRPAGEHGPGGPGRARRRPRHAAAAPDAPDPFMGRARLPAARLRPAKRTSIRPRSWAWPGRRCLHRRPGGAIAGRGHRPRGRRGHGVRDDAAALGPGVLGGRRHRRRRRRRALPHGDRGAPSSAFPPWSAPRSARPPSRQARPSPSTAPRASCTSTARRDRGGHGPHRLVAAASRPRRRRGIAPELLAGLGRALGQRPELGPHHCRVPRGHRSPRRSRSRSRR